MAVFCRHSLLQIINICTSSSTLVLIFVLLQYTQCFIRRDMELLCSNYVKNNNTRNCITNSCCFYSKVSWWPNGYGRERCHVHRLLCLETVSIFGSQLPVGHARCGSEEARKLSLNMNGKCESCSHISVINALFFFVAGS